MNTKKLIKRTGRGYTFLFLIKLSLIGAFFIVQSCQEHLETEPDGPSEIAVKRFASFLKNEKTILDEKLGKLDQAAFEANNHQTNITEDQAQEIMSEVISESLIFLYESGLSEDLIKEELGDTNDPLVFVAASTILLGVLTNEQRQGTNLEHSPLYEFSFMHEAKAQSYGPVVDCALRALGIAAIGEWVGGSVAKLGTRAFLKAVAKIAGRSISVFGWMFATWDFLACLDKHL